MVLQLRAAGKRDTAFVMPNGVRHLVIALSRSVIGPGPSRALRVCICLSSWGVLGMTESCVVIPNEVRDLCVILC